MSTLTGVKIVSMALNVPGPLAAARLLRLGASVVKVEPPSGDPLATLCPTWYAELLEGMRLERLDLKSAEGRGRMLELLSDATVFISSQRPSAIGRLRLDAQTLATQSETLHLRTLNIVGDCSHPEHAGHDLTYVASAGLLGSGLPRSLAADILGAERAFSAALLLLREPSGAHVEVGLVDSLEPLIAPLRHGFTKPGGLLGGGLAAYGVYDTRDGRVAVAAIESHFRQRLYQSLGRPLDAPLADAFLARTAMEWETWGRAHDVPISAVKD